MLRGSTGGGDGGKCGALASRTEVEERGGSGRARALLFRGLSAFITDPALAGEPVTTTLTPILIDPDLRGCCANWSTVIAWTATGLYVLGFAAYGEAVRSISWEHGCIRKAACPDPTAGESDAAMIALLEDGRLLLVDLGTATDAGVPLQVDVLPGRSCLDFAVVGRGTVLAATASSDLQQQLVRIRLPSASSGPTPSIYSAHPSRSPVTNIARHLALLSSGDVVSHGRGGLHGELGHGLMQSGCDDSAYEVVEHLEGLGCGIVACGSRHSAVALKCGGVVYTFGEDRFGQLGAAIDLDVEDDAVVHDGGHCAGRDSADVEETPPAGVRRTNAAVPWPVAVDVEWDDSEGKWKLGDVEEVTFLVCGERHIVASDGFSVFGWGDAEFGAVGHRGSLETDRTARTRMKMPQMGNRQTVIGLECGAWTTLVLIEYDAEADVTVI
ncbi:RCC1 domain-containing protein 1 [Irineochytrium annulatum]|nr:RCC1 domain-containing protein 1 [Irineochytrium annulatum]